MAEAIGALATLTCSFFAGASVYINFVEHPARLSCGTEVAARQWAPSHKRATVMQVSLALLATLAGLGRWLGGGGVAWLIGALLIVSVIPFTLVVIRPTNDRLLHLVAIPARPRRASCSRPGAAFTRQERSERDRNTPCS